MLEIEIFTGGVAATNGYLCGSGNRWFLVDAPEGVAEWVAERGLRVEALLLTHAHFDHVLDAAAIQQAHACPLLAFAAPTPSLTLEHFLGVFGGSLAVAAYQVTELLTEASRPKIAGLDFQIFHIPGHSVDSLAFFCQEEDVVFSGDTLMAGGVGRCDFPGGSWEILEKGIQDKLYTLPDSTRVFAGHGPMTRVGEEKMQNRFVQPR